MVSEGVIAGVAGVAKTLMVTEPAVPARPAPLVMVQVSAKVPVLPRAAKVMALVPWPVLTVPPAKAQA